MVYILHIDTSGDVGTVTIARDGQVLHSSANPDTRNQAASINLMIDEVLQAAGIALNDISAICVCAGPGSYTGLRIGMATAKALCYVLDKPLLLDNKLTLLAYNQYHKHLSEYDFYVAVLTAREGEYFISSHDNKFDSVIGPTHVFEAGLATLDTWKGAVLLVGGIKETILNDLNASNLKIISTNTIDLSSWALYAFDQYHCNRNVILSTSEPFYLKQVFTHNKKNIR